MSLKIKTRPLQELFDNLVWFVSIIFEIILQFFTLISKAETLLDIILDIMSAVVPLVMFLLWTVTYVYKYRTVFLFQDYREAQIIEIARAYIYFFTLPIAITFNIFAAFSNLSIKLIIIPLVGITLGVTVKIISKIFFSNLVKSFNEIQKRYFKETISFAGGAAIYYSMIVAGIYYLLTQLRDYYIRNSSSIIFSIPLLLLFFLILFQFVYKREKKSRECAAVLANSMRKKWKKRYLVKRGKKA